MFSIKSLAMKIAIMVKSGDIKKLFITNTEISKLDIPSTKGDEETKLDKRPNNKINGII